MSRFATSLIAAVSLVAVVLSRVSLASVDTSATPNPVPLVNQPLLPDATKPGGGALTLTVNGTGFVSSALVHWNGSALATTFVSSSQLKATILPSDVAKAGTASVTVVNPAPGGGTSNVVFFEVTTATSSIALSAPRGFDAGSGPQSVAVGDFNGDGKPDLAVVNSYSNNVSILLGNGDGTFQIHVDYPTGAQPGSVAIGDFNGDGKLDLAVVNSYSNNVSVLLGNGNGTFQPAVSYGTGSGTGPAFVAVGDFNHDGKLDLAVANSNSSNVSVLLGNGDGTFQTAVNYDVGGAPTSIAVGDFNHDGKLDLAVANSNSTYVSVLLGNGDGTFQTAVNYDVGGAPTSIAVGDFNHDGKLDLAVAVPVPGPSTYVSVLLGNGDGTFQTAVNYNAPYAPDAVAVGDFNGDGNLDLVVGNRSSNISVFLGNGDGTFRTAVNYSAGYNPSSVAVGDFNNDGTLDLAVANSGSSTTVTVLLQSPTVSLSNTRLTYANQVVATSSASQTVTLSNTSALALNISSIVITGTNATDFAQTHTCGASLSPGASCTISLTFKPTQLGSRAASVTITDNAAVSPQQIALSGTGVTSGPNATLSASLTFAAQTVGTASSAQSVTLINYGRATLGITRIATSGDFSQTHTCGSSLAVLASCTISVTFTPTQQGSRAGTLSITDNAPGSPQTVSLSGTGTTTQSADLSTSIQGPTICAHQGNIVYTITVTNHGPNTASNVVMTDSTPLHTAFTGVTTTTGSCTTPPVGGAGTVSCKATSLPNAASMTIKLDVKITFALHNQAIGDTATATSATFDPTTADNTAGTVCRVN